MKKFVFALMLSSLTTAAFAACANSVAEFRQVVMGDNAYPTSWRETTADDGKPLALVLSDRGGLHLEFKKGGQLYAQGNATICQGSGNKITARFSRITWGPGASRVPTKPANGTWNLTATPTSMSMRVGMGPIGRTIRFAPVR